MLPMYRSVSTRAAYRRCQSRRSVRFLRGSPPKDDRMCRLTEMRLVVDVRQRTRDEHVLLAVLRKPVTPSLPLSVLQFESSDANRK
jgi:hypothetical protein